jgi:hypothetical protein
LERRRNCGWLGIEASARRPIVWSGGGQVAAQCPVSTSAGVSAWIELYALWRSGVARCDGGWSAKDVEALAVLEEEARRRSDVTD